MDFVTYLKTSAQEINQSIKQTLITWSKEVKNTSPKIIPLNDAFIEACQCGKRLRGTLIRLGYDMLASQSNQDVFKVAAGIEIFQTAILAHDDIIDLSSLRRGRPTLYKYLGGDHRAISHTIVLSDIGFFISTGLLANSNFPDSRKNKAISLFAKMFTNTGLGELLDVEIPYLKQERLEKDVLMIHKLKTADYTITYPLIIGAVLGGGKESLLELIMQLGENLGIAFQIQDDILGVFGDEEIVGKSVTSDIEEGKNTLLIIYALDHGNKDQKEILKKYYGKGKISKREHKLIKKVFIESGALKYSQDKATKLVEKAKKVIDKMEIAQDKKILLNQMADFLVNRQK